MLEFLRTVVTFFTNSMDKIILSVVIIAVGFVLFKVIQRTIHSRVAKEHIRKQDGFLVVKLTKGIIVVGGALAFVLIWQGSIQNFWIGLTSVFGIVAIGFFAVWSILSNIVSGIVIILLKTINIGDQIEVMGDGIQGRIEDVTLFYVILVDRNDNRVAIPNNLFIQKIIRVTPS